MEKIFYNYSSLKPLKPIESKLGWNVFWMTRYKILRFFVSIDQKSKMVTNIGHSFNKVPYGKMKKIIPE